MTKRDIRNRVENLEDDADGEPLRVIIERTCHDSVNDDEAYTYEKVIEIGGN